MLNIEAVEIKRPFKLSEVAVYFGEHKHRLLAQLSALAAEEKIFAHDLVKVSETDDYELSGYAVTLLITEYGMTHERLIKLAAFLDERTDSSNNRCFLVNTYVTMKSLQLKITNHAIMQDTEEIQAKHRDDEIALDDLVKLVPCYSHLEN